MPAPPARAPHRKQIKAKQAKGLCFLPVTGDCLFPGGVGKTWEDGAFDRLLADVTSRIFDVYGDDTVVYPGHGDDTTLGARAAAPGGVERARLVDTAGGASAVRRPGC